VKQVKIIIMRIQKIITITIILVFVYLSGCQNQIGQIPEDVEKILENAAEDAAFEVYLLNPPGVQAVATAKFKSTLVAEMAKYAGTVTETSPGIGITVLDKDITIAQYPIIWNFGC
jgi:hypothetical protein